MKKKGNISLLVLFVLVACSLLGIIAVQYTKHMAIQTNQIYNYYKTYYLAKGGSEIGLSLLKLRGAGFGFEIQENDDFVKQNTSTGNSFSLKIQGSNSFLSEGYPDTKDCTNPYIIKSGDAFILPLFIDHKDITINDLFSEEKFYQNKSYLLKELKIIDTENSNNNIGIGIIISSGGILSQTGIFFKTGVFLGNNFFENLSDDIQVSFNTFFDRNLLDRQHNTFFQNYLIIANKDYQELTFCLKLTEGNELPLPKTYISSFGYAGNKKMGLEIIYQQPIPSYLIDSSIF